MPAIQLARLKIQIAHLLSYYDQPNEFVREFHLLMEFYADRTRRPGQSGTPKPLIQAYNVPRQVMRRIKSDIQPLVVNDHLSALELADKLWMDRWYECGNLAISILGMVPLVQSNLIVDRLQLWGKNCHDDALFVALLEDGAVGIREETPDEYQRLVEDWLSDTEISLRKIGLQAIPALVLNPTFENLPVVFRLLSPLVRESASALETDLLRAVRALGQRSPHETAFFLKQNLAAPHKSGLGVITRRSLDVFPPDLQNMLRDELRVEMRS